MSNKEQTRVMCYNVLVGLLNKNDLTTASKVSKALDITQALAKKIIKGDIKDMTQDQIISWTSKIILNKLGL
jgi:predicted XRE-type DNA-binding protein